MTTKETEMKNSNEKRYTLREVAQNHVILRDAGTGREVEYWCPERGGYVRRVTEDRPGTLGQQVCDGLQESGSTLVHGRGRRGTRPLIDTIREEARVAYDAYDHAETMAACEVEDELAGEKRTF